MSEYDDKILKQLADAYVEQYGNSLLSEQQAIQQQKVSYATPRADKIVKKLIRGHNSNKNNKSSNGNNSNDSNNSQSNVSHNHNWRKKIPFYATAAAAAFLVIFVGAFAVITNTNSILMPASNTNAELSANSQDSSPKAPDYSESLDMAPDSNATSPLANLTPADKWSSLQALNFNLPAQFQIAHTDYDNGESIYQLDNNQHDNVILTMQNPRNQGNWDKDLDSIVIDGKSVSAVLTNEYKLLQFTDSGILYTISCRDDIATLSSLYRSIVDPENKKI